MYKQLTPVIAQKGGGETATQSQRITLETPQQTETALLNKQIAPTAAPAERPADDNDMP